MGMGALSKENSTILLQTSSVKMRKRSESLYSTFREVETGSLNNFIKNCDSSISRHM